MKFQWYIINLVEGTVEGTNDVEQLEKFIEDDSYLLLIGQHGSFFNGNREVNEVFELDTSDEDVED